MKLLLSLLLVFAVHAYDPGSGDEDYDDESFRDAYYIYDDYIEEEYNGRSNFTEPEKPIITNYPVGDNIVQCQKYQGLKTCHVVDHKNVIVLTGTGDSKHHCTKRFEYMLTCSLNYTDKISYLVSESLETIRGHLYTIVNDAKQVHVTRLCRIDHMIFTNIADLKFIHSGCMTGTLEATNVTMKSFRERFHNVFIFNSTIDNLRIPSKISNLKLQGDTVNMLSIHLYFLAAKYHSIINGSSIYSIDQLHVDASDDKEQTFTIIDSKLDNILTDSFISTVKTIIHDSKITNVNAHGIHIRNSASLINVAFDKINKHGIIIEPQPDSIIELTHLKIYNCIKPCFAIVINDERNYTLMISDLIINNHIIHDNLKDFVEILNYKNPLNSSIASAGSKYCNATEEAVLVCKFQNDNQEYSLVPGADEKYKAISLQNHKYLTIYYSCVAKFVLTRIKGNFYPSDNLHIGNCLNPMRITAKHCNFETADLRTPTLIEGYAFKMRQLYAYAPFNITRGAGVSIETLLHYVAMKNTTTLWHKLHVGEIYNTTVNGSLKILNSDVLSLRNFTINENGSLHLLSSDVVGATNFIVKKGGLLAFVFSSLSEDEGEIVLEEGAKLYLEHYVQNPNPHDIPYDYKFIGRRKSKLFSISKFDQVDGPFRWYSNSSFWIQDFVKVLHRNPEDGLPAFNKTTAATLFELHKNGTCTYDSAPSTNQQKTLCDLKSESMDIVGSNEGHYMLQAITTYSATINFINGNSVRFQPSRVSHTRVSFENCKNSSLIQDHSSVIHRFYLINSSSPVLRGIFNLVNMHNSNISIVSNVQTKYMAATYSEIRILNSEVESMALDDTKITFLEKLLITHNLTISNCHIHHVNSSAFFASENSHIIMTNVTIGTLERESFNLQNTFEITNVTVKFAAHGSFIVPILHGTVFQDVLIEDSDGDPFHIKDISIIEMNEVYVRGKKYNFHEFKTVEIKTILSLEREVMEQACYKVIISCAISSVLIYMVFAINRQFFKINAIEEDQQELLNDQNVNIID